MDRLLISLKFTLLRHSSKGLRQTGWYVGGALVVATWAGGVLAASDEARASVLALAFAVWGVGAMLGPVLMSGTGVLRPDYFGLLPIERRVLGRGLLVSSFVSIASAFVLLAFLGAGVHAALLDPATIVVVLIGAPLTWVLAITLSRLVFGLLGAAMRSRLGVEIAGIQFGLMFAAMFTGWMIVQVAIENVPALVSDGLPTGPITAVLDAFPTSWMLLSVERAAGGDWAGAGLLLLALAALDAVLIAAAILVLTPRTSPGSQRRRGRARSPHLVDGGGILPATPTWAVVQKELRQWSRDPWRSLELRSCVWTGIAIGGFALISGHYAVLSAFAGLIVAFMLGVGACNLYGQDGSAVWLNIVGEDETSVRADVRGRQWATILIFLPQAILISGIFVVLSGELWTIPVLLAALPAVFGAASGAALLISAAGVSPGVDPRRRTGPNDATGNITIHVWVAFVLTAIGSLPTVGAIVWTLVTPAPWVGALAVVIGLLNGWLAAWLLGRVAIGYLSTRLPDVFSRIRYTRIFRQAHDDRGILDWIERFTLKGEQDAKERQQKERDTALAERG